MQNRNTNFKLTKTNSGGGSKGPKKPTTRDRLDKIENILLQVSIRLDKFIIKQEKFNAKQEKNWKEQRKFNQYVLNMFKKHKWVK